MLDLMPDAFSDIDNRFLEPSCGCGNFLVAILERKLRKVARRYRRQKNKSPEDFEFNSLRALASIYGIDIDLKNVNESRKQMKGLTKWFHSNHLNTYESTEGYEDSMNYIINLNITRGDMLNGIGRIKLTEFDSSEPLKFRQRIFKLSTLIEVNRFDWVEPLPIREISTKNYWELAKQ